MPSLVLKKSRLFKIRYKDAPPITIGGVIFLFLFKILIDELYSF